MKNDAPPIELVSRNRDEMLDTIGVTDQVPHDIEAEQALLGAVMTANEAMNHVGPDLKPEHFYVQQHQRIFAAILDLREKGVTADILTIKHHFADTEVVIKDQYLARLAGAATSIIKADDYANLIIELAARRRLLGECEETARSLRYGTTNSTEAMTTMRSADDGIASGTTMFHDARFVARKIYDGLNMNLAPVSTGLPRLDAAMGGGMFPGKMYGFGARKKTGKTILAATVSHNLNYAGVPHLFIACEMGEEEVHQRSMARALQIYPSTFRNPNTRYDNHLMERIAELAAKGPRNAVYLDSPGIQFDHLKNAVGLAVMKYGIKVVILDCWQLVDGRQRSESTAEHQFRVAQWMATASKKLGIASFVTAQMNQTGNTLGGEGIRLSCDQFYQLHLPDDDPSVEGRWMEMLETRYTGWRNVGSNVSPGLRLNDFGPYFDEEEEIDEAQPTFSMSGGDSQPGKRQLAGKKKSA